MRRIGRGSAASRTGRIHVGDELIYTCTNVYSYLYILFVFCDILGEAYRARECGLANWQNSCRRCADIYVHKCVFIFIYFFVCCDILGEAYRARGSAASRTGRIHVGDELIHSYAYVYFHFYFFFCYILREAYRPRECSRANSQNPCMR